MRAPYMPFYLALVIGEPWSEMARYKTMAKLRKNKARFDVACKEFGITWKAN